MNLLNTHNKEASTQKYSLHFNIHVQRELDTKVGGITDAFLKETTPLFCDSTDRLFTNHAFYLKTNLLSAV